MDNTIIEGNKLIADFVLKPYMDMITAIYPYPGFPHSQSNGHQGYEPLKYHSSWDWLMPVVINIFSLKLKEKGEELFITESDHYTNKIHNSLTISIEAAFEAVVKFVQWYNSLTPNEIK